MSLSYVDLRDVITDTKTYLLEDGIHPNAVGQDNLYNTTVNRLK